MNHGEKGKRRNKTDGIPSLRRWHWQAWEIHLLGKVRDSVLAELLGRSLATVSMQRHRLGIAKEPELTMTHWQVWVWGEKDST